MEVDSIPMEISPDVIESTPPVIAAEEPADSAGNEIPPDLTCEAHLENDSRKRMLSETSTSDKEDEPPPNLVQEVEMAEQSAKSNKEPTTPSASTTVDTNLGKGKRARIPNKRYSDIIMSPQSRPPPRPVENGIPETTIEVPENIADVAPTPSKKQKVVDIHNPNFLNPFKYGWKRELVYRAHLDHTKRRVPGDIYYYTPQGKKIRSLRELAEVLRHSKELSMDDFTFAKESLGVDDPEKEILRDAKAFVRRTTMTAKSSETPTKSTSKSHVRSSIISSSKTKSSASSKKDEHGDGDSTPKTKRKSAKAPSTKLLTGTSPRGSSNRKGQAKTTAAASIPIAANKPDPNRSPASVTSATSSTFHSENYLQSLSYGYRTLLHIFQHLKIQDLLRAGCVCQMWRDIASHPSLWRTVKLKNSQVYSFDGLANSLRNHGTVSLDLRKMLLPEHSTDDIWMEFIEAIRRVVTLRKLELCRCPAYVVERLVGARPDLEVLNALTIKNEEIQLSGLSKMTQLTELRIKSSSGLKLSDVTLEPLAQLTHLKVLSLTTVKEICKVDLHAIGLLNNLLQLDLGECKELPDYFGPVVLAKLTKLEKLRLEKGREPGTSTLTILNAVSEISTLQHLELVDFDVKPGFETALGKCTNIKKLLLIPTYVSQSATTNHTVLRGLLNLKRTLRYFVWVVTLELLRVTELFVGQCKEDNAPIASNGARAHTGPDSKPVDSIPILKPVPLNSEENQRDDDDRLMPGTSPQPALATPVGENAQPQVQILPLVTLQHLLGLNLPQTKVEILKIPYNSTWRQTIKE